MVAIVSKRRAGGALRNKKQWRIRNSITMQFYFMILLFKFNSVRFSWVFCGKWDQGLSYEGFVLKNYISSFAEGLDESLYSWLTNEGEQFEFSSKVMRSSLL